MAVGEGVTAAVGEACVGVGVLVGTGLGVGEGANVAVGVGVGLAHAATAIAIRVAKMTGKNRGRKDLARRLGYRTYRFRTHFRDMRHRSRAAEYIIEPS